VLLNNSVDSREGDKEKNTPLHFACKYGRAKNVELLLSDSKYCDFTKKNKEGNMAIHLAALNGHIDCIKLLINAGQKITVPGKNRMQVIHFAAAYHFFRYQNEFISK